MSLNYALMKLSDINYKLLERLIELLKEQNVLNQFKTKHSFYCFNHIFPYNYDFIKLIDLFDKNKIDLRVILNKNLYSDLFKIENEKAFNKSVGMLDEIVFKALKIHNKYFKKLLCKYDIFYYDKDIIDSAIFTRHLSFNYSKSSISWKI